MANITRRSNTGNADPWRDFFDLGFFGNRFPERSNALPDVNFSEDEKNFTVDVVSPGFKKEDFKVNVDDDILTISAENKSETNENKGKEYSRREYNYSSFTRSFRLPDNAKDDSISAKYNDGILNITIPKSETQQKASKQISID